MKRVSQEGTISFIRDEKMNLFRRTSVACASNANRPEARSRALQMPAS